MKYLIINGIFTNKNVVKQIKNNIEYFCNDSENIYVFEWPEYNRFMFIFTFIICKFLCIDIEAIYKLEKDIKYILDNTDEDLQIISHSYGGLILNRTINKLPNEYKKRLNVFSFGSAEYINNNEIKNIFNIWNEYDYVQIFVLTIFNKNNIIKIPHNKLNCYFEFEFNNSIKKYNLKTIHESYSYLMYKYKALPFKCKPYYEILCKNNLIKVE